MKNQKKDSNKLEIEQFKKQVEEYKNKYLRALADYQNLEKKTREERQSLIKSANSHLILRLLPFLDTLDAAEIFVKDEGLKLAKNQLEAILKEMGLVEVEVLNKEFNPHLAEAIEMVAGEKDNQVVEVLRKGYKLEEKILRVAQVKVSKRVN